MKNGEIDLFVSCIYKTICGKRRKFLGAVVNGNKHYISAWTPNRSKKELVNLCVKSLIGKNMDEK